MTRIGDLLIAANLVTAGDIDAAVKQQAAKGGRLGEILVELGAIEKGAIEGFLKHVPVSPASIAETGIPEGDLLNLLIKQVYIDRLTSLSSFIEGLKLPHHIVTRLVQNAVEHHLLLAAGSNQSGGIADMRYNLTEEGHRWALEALSQSQYSGPAPVSLESFTERVGLQKVTNEQITWDRIREAFSDLTIADAFVEQIGPAVNGGRAILLYGPPGNGKTSVALRLRKVFNDVIYMPYALMVEGQIIRVYDPSLHVLSPATPPAAGNGVHPVRREEYDSRWVPCRRPFVVTGGELTLEMLDLSYNSVSQFYEAPLHVKALGGCFIIDDFGRQQVSPSAILNRWIVPLESRVDYLKLHTGKSFMLPFEELVLFSTNLEPEDLMDQAFLRRIPYKLEVGGPTRKQFREIFDKLASAAALELTDEMFDAVVMAIAEKKQLNLANFHPRFIIDQVLAACKFMQLKPRFEARFVDYAVNNLRVNRADDKIGAPSELAARRTAARVT